ncbi:3-oxoacyl-ACP synthase III family protein [Sphingobacterium faecale]|uniref:Ketoacyl-ACP synthase III n=1 Tax=Sphingobacterium faecale TaxID=2803775 RepID=A0ABS1R2X1_9SPHI|nr:3-oxoacyl-[acyl-carrier-protein] synthase III C-terminal domain-containing protein [Sphingobacterium faecale]MBL1409048.1 ketoacyl-ACP synthase III [Sphingobacterium faecale]
MIRSKIIGTGAYIPTEVVGNHCFLNSNFFTDGGVKIEQSTETIIRKFKDITGIEQRRYASLGIGASDMGAFAAEEAIKNSGIDRESIDLIVVAHNYGEMYHLGAPRDMVPSVASRIKNKLSIQSTSCIPYDVIFGCPGWVQGVIQADMAIRCGEARTCLVIGTDTLSRVLDSSDRDSMIFSDGAGACIIQAVDGTNSGIINTAVRSDTGIELDYIISAGENSGEVEEPQFIKMKGRKVYEYALKYVPQAMKECFDRSSENINDLKMIFLHQANDKMDEAIVKRFFELYGIAELPENIMPMNIAHMGNSSVATIPTLLHQVLNREIGNFAVQEGDLIMFASVGAGMNINAITYRW